MFNFNHLTLVKRCDSDSHSSFVGIRRGVDNQFEFRLPHGFDNFPTNENNRGDFNATKQLFFKMYRTFKKFENDKTRLPIDERPAGKDNIEKMGNAYRFKDKEDNEVLLYSKISVIENLLEAYDDLALDVIERRYGLDEKIDYSKIDRYLHKAVYLDDDVIYLDEMELPRHVLRYESTTIIDLFCFILYELKRELDEEKKLDERVKELAHRFKEQHLSHDQSLFNEETFETTMSILKDILDDIDKVTAYKDEDYWRLYEAIECFLYGELDMQNTHKEGIFWGISNFYQIWEDMCNTYAFDKFGVEKIIYADTNIKFNGKPIANATFGGHKIFKQKNFENPFFIEFRKDKRWMRPDLIYEISGSKSIFNNSIKISVTRSYFGLLDFEVKLITNDDTIKNVYKLFLYKLKNSKLNNNPYSSYRKSSKIRIEGNSFKNYPEISLEEQKKFIEDKYTPNNDILRILDWKYMDEKAFENKSQKLDADITKQICYEFCLKESNEEKSIESQFVIPSYDDKNKEIKELIEEIWDMWLYSRLSENSIKVFKANFQLIQEVYLNHD